MTTLRHHVRAAGVCFTQSQRRCVAMRPVVASQEDKISHLVFAGTAGTGRPVAVISVWNKKTGAGNQN